MRKVSRLALCIAALLIVGRLLWPQAPYILSFFSNRMIDSTAILRLGDPSLSHLDGSGSSVDRHPVGMNFYQKEFPQGSYGTVEFMHDPHSFQADNVLSAIGTEDMAVPGGIFKWKINFGPSDQQADTPEVARDRLMRFLATLRAAGWKRFIDINRPRLDGRQAWQFGTSGDASGDYSLDSTYTPTIDEWKTSASAFPQWIFYADGVYVTVSVQESTMGGFAGKRIYLFSVEVKNEYGFYAVDYFGGQMDNTKLRNWTTFLPAELQKQHAKRLRAEAVLKAQGYRIDTTYEDPPIKELESASSAN